MDKLKQTKNLIKKLIKVEESVLYAVDRLNRLLSGKAKKLLYEKGNVFWKYYLDLQDKNVLCESKEPKKSIPFYTPFVEQRKDIDRLSALYSIIALFKIMHPDIAGIQFFSKSAVNPRYCLLVSIFSLLKRISIQ